MPTLPFSSTRMTSLPFVFITSGFASVVPRKLVPAVVPAFPVSCQNGPLFAVVATSAVAAWSAVVAWFAFAARAAVLAERALVANFAFLATLALLARPARFAYPAFFAYGTPRAVAAVCATGVVPSSSA